MNPSNSKLFRTDKRSALLLACSFAAFTLGVQPAAAAVARDEANAPDPYEKINRVSFYFSGALDFLIIRPLAITFKRVTPRPIREVLHNGFSNFGEPAIFINDVAQGHVHQAAKTFGRFAMNSTIGVAGAFDVASGAGLPHHDNDFGITLARYGVKSGPYIYIPILGPGTLRDGVGLGINYAIDPFTYLRFPQSTAVYWGRTVGNGLDERAAVDKQIKAITANSLDDYASIRSFYLQNRESDITGGKLDIDTLPDFGAPTGVKPPSSTPASTSEGAPLPTTPGEPAAASPPPAPPMETPPAPPAPAPQPSA
jgi:phospholipid-binding lipoprotein MlaA